MNFFFIFPKYDKCNFLNPPLVNMNKTILYMVVVCSGEFANHTIIFSTSSLNLPQVPIRGHNMSRCKHSRSGGDFCLKGRNWWGVMSYFQTCFANFLWTFLGGHPDPGTGILVDLDPDGSRWWFQWIGFDIWPIYFFEVWNPSTGLKVISHQSWSLFSQKFKFLAESIFKNKNNIVKLVENYDFWAKILTTAKKIHNFWTRWWIFEKITF